MAIVELTEQQSPSWRTYLISIGIGILLGSGIGWWAHHTWTDGEWRDKLNAMKLEFQADKAKLLGEISGLKLLNVEQSKELVRAKANVQTVTEVAYVDKIVYRDPVTGKETKEKTDVEVVSTPPQYIGLKYNGKSYEIPLKPGEKHKFDDGKLVVNQTMSGSIDITTKVKRGVTLDLVGQAGAETSGLQSPTGFGRVMIEARVPLF